MGGFIVSGGGDEAFLGGIGKVLYTSDHTFAIKTNVLGIPGTIRIQTEDITAKSCQDGHVLVAATCHGKCILNFTFRFQRSTNFEHLSPGCGRGGNQVCVVEEAKVLSGVRYTIEFAVGIGESLQRGFNKFALLVTHVDGSYQTTLDQCTQPVMDT